MKKTVLIGMLLMAVISAGAQNEKGLINSNNLNLQNDSTDYDSSNFNEQMLNEVSVTAKKSIVKMDTDKLTYNVQDDASAQASTVLEMLRKVPMVTVDAQDNISVNGKQSVKILVDGKENPIISQNASMVLKMMPASTIEKVEVVTSPGAKYDAEGVGGVINIITVGNAQKKMQSFGGNAVAGTKNLGGGLNTILQMGKFSLSANGSVMRMKISDIETEMAMTQSSAIGESNMLTSANSNNTMLFANGNLQMSYEIDSLRLLSAKASVISTNTTTDSRSTTGVNGIAAFSTMAHNKSRVAGINAGFDYQRTFSSNNDKMLTLSYLFTTSPKKTEEKSDFALLGTTGAFNVNDRLTDMRLSTCEHTLQIDYTSPLTTNLVFDAGMKLISRSNRSEAQVLALQNGNYILDAQQSIDFENNHSILAAYSELAFRKDGWQAKAGLRFENTWDKLSYLNNHDGDVNSDYRNLVPSAMIGYRFGAADNLGATYNLRINRPAVSMLSPFVNNSDPTMLRYGNPDLAAERTHNIALTFSHIGKVTCNLNLAYSFCNGGIGSYSFAKDGLLHETYGNINRTQQFTLSSFAVVSLSPKTKLTAYGNASYSDFSSDMLPNRNSGLSGTMMINLDQSFANDWRATASAMGVSRTMNLQGGLGGLSMLNATVSKSLMKKSLTLALTGMLPLSGKKLSVGITSAGENYSNSLTIRMPMANIAFSASFNVGGAARVKTARKSIVNDDVKAVESNADKINSATK